MGGAVNAILQKVQLLINGFMPLVTYLDLKECLVLLNPTIIISEANKAKQVKAKEQVEGVICYTLECLNINIYKLT